MPNLLEKEEGEERLLWEEQVCCFRKDREIRNFVIMLVCADENSLSCPGP